MDLQDRRIGGILQQQQQQQVVVEEKNRVDTFSSTSTKQQQPLPPRIDNIAHLYSQLQAAFDKSSSSSTTRNKINTAISHNNNNRNNTMTTRDSLSDIQQRTSLSSSSTVSDVPSTCRSSTESGFYTPSNSSSNANSPITPSHTTMAPHHHHSPQLQLQQQQRSLNSTETKHISDVCSCHHWLVSIDSEHCGICDEPIPHLQSWQQERHLESQTIKRTQSQFYRLQDKHQEYQETIQNLVKTIHEKESVIERRTIELESLQQDLKILHTKCHGERQQVKEIQQSKECVKRELEELSQRLFEEANVMVSSEKKEKERIQIQHEKSKKALEQAKQDLIQVELELCQLRKEIGLLDETTLPPRPSSALSGYHEQHQQQQQQRQSGSFSFRDSSSHHNASGEDSYYSPSSSPIVTGATVMGPETVMMRAQIDLATQHNNNNQNQTMPLQIEASEDDHCLMEFRQFIDSASTISLRKLHSLPYMKQCLEDDVRPTLRFGPNPKLTSRKIVDSILVKTCFVETCPRGFVNEQLEQQQQEASETITSLWERFSSSSSSSSTVFEGCQACGRPIEREDREQVLKYRFRTSYFDEWTCIDKFCRDRIEAVIQFYSYLRQLRIGAYRQRSLTEVYQECSRLRLQMCLTRMGTLPAVLQSSGFDPNILVRATTGNHNGKNHLAPGDDMNTRFSSSTASTLTL
ncbi:hypothetical protein BDC45DRAFT_506482 [Circinella umbellata]|nr:hypothetical protein BDC45DRAFT_506482 [Circinella umbellata]